MEKLRRILIVDGHTLLSAGLRVLLAGEADIELVVEADQDREAAPADGKLAPHLLLVDGTTPGMNLVDTVAQIKRRYPDARLLLIMPHKTGGFDLARLQAGIDGCIRKDATHEELRAAIRGMLQGRSCLDIGGFANAVDAHPGGRRSGAANALDALTQRERDVLKLVAAGKSSRHIAECLSLSVNTVGKHRANLMAKLDVHNAAGLTACAIGRGLLANPTL